MSIYQYKKLPILSELALSNLTLLDCLIPHQAEKEIRNWEIYRKRKKGKNT